MTTTTPPPDDEAVPPFAEGATAPSEIDTPVTASTWRELQAAGALSTPDGTVALRLAAALDDRAASGAALAALAPRHAAALDRARARTVPTRNAAPAAPVVVEAPAPLDEVAARRARLADGGGMPR